MARTALWIWLKRMTGEALKQVQSQQDGPKNQDGQQDPTTVSRRQFLKMLSGTAVTVGLASVSGLAHSQKGIASPKTAPVSTSKKTEKQKVIIIGAGLAGLVSAYRLTQLGIPCEIYEASHRVGGRVFTRRNFNKQGMFVELGGELVDTNHEALIGMCEELKVPLERFPTPEAGIEPALFIHGQQVRTEEDVIQAFQPLANALARDLKRIFPDGEVQIPTYQNPCGAEWLDALSLATYLNQLTEVPAWLIAVIKAAYTGEYGLDPSEQSALNLLLLIDPETQSGFRMFGESDEAMRIQGGNGRLPDALYEAIRRTVPVHFGYKLTHLQHSESQSESPIGLTFHHRQRKVRVQANRVLLALPFSVLRQVSGLESLGLSPRKLKAIKEWGYGSNSKQMMAFESRFWQQTAQPYPASSGELFTDWDSQCYWETSRLQPGESGILTNFLGGKAGFSADANQWQKALADLDTVYQGQAQAQYSGRQALMNWSRHPWAQASYTCPRPGQYTTLMGVAGEPELGGKLWFAGEHCSVDWAGFMNGAVESGLQAAKQIADPQTALESDKGFG